MNKNYSKMEENYYPVKIFCGYQLDFWNNIVFGAEVYASLEKLCQVYIFSFDNFIT